MWNDPVGKSQILRSGLAVHARVYRVPWPEPIVRAFSSARRFRSTAQLIRPWDAISSGPPKIGLGQNSGQRDSKVPWMPTGLRGVCHQTKTPIGRSHGITAVNPESRNRILLRRRVASHASRSCSCQCPPDQRCPLAKRWNQQQHVRGQCQADEESADNPASQWRDEHRSQGHCGKIAPRSADGCSRRLRQRRPTARWECRRTRW